MGTTELERDVSSSFRVGAGEVDTTPAPLTSDTVVGQRGVTIIPDPGNAGALFVGPDAGFDPLNSMYVPSSGITIPVAKPSEIFVASTVAGAKYYWLAC